MTRRKDPAEIRVPVPAEDLPAFAPVPVKFRHDGWTPERQRAFIGALADTGSERVPTKVLLSWGPASAPRAMST